MTLSTTNLKVLAPEQNTPPPRTLTLWGPVLLLLALTLLALALVWLQGELLHVTTADAKKTASIGILLTLVGLLLLHLLACFIGGYSVAGWLFRWAARSADVTPAPDVVLSAGSSLEALRHALKAYHRVRWRYRQPWLLLTGNDKAIERLLPELVEHGYLFTDDAVLLWRRSDDNKHPDETWLKQLYAMRRRRPIDCVVLVLSGAEDRLVPVCGVPAYGINMVRIVHTLHWSAPVYVLDVDQVDEVEDGATPVVGCTFTRATHAEPIEADLLTLRSRLAGLGIERLCADRRDDYLAKLSQRLDTRASKLADLVASFAAHRLSTRGVFFAPFPARPGASTDTWERGLAPIWSHLSQMARRNEGRRTGSHPISVMFTIALGLIGLWTAGMLVSVVSNADDIRDSLDSVQSLHQGDDAAHIRALLALQQRIGMYEARVQHHSHGLRGFGVNRDRETLSALWAHYANASRALLTRPVEVSLEKALADLGKVQADALQDHDAQRRDYQRLKAYLMLAEPARADAPFLAGQIATAWPMVTSMSRGEWWDTSQRLARFYAEHLAAHPDWRIQPSELIVSAARSTLVNQVGLANADDVIYRAIMNNVRGKYADASLPTLLNGTDADGLFFTSATVPGGYTRAAWDGMVSEAIDKAASEQRVEKDWVLTGEAKTTAAPNDNADGAGLKQRLTNRYFADYAAAWQHMLNSIQWQPAANINVAIDQLTRMTDAQTSPLIALMKSVQYQAQAGHTSQAIGDALVQRAQGLFTRDGRATEQNVHPLAQSFGPLLALMGDSVVTQGKDGGQSANAAASLAGVSLQSYLTASTVMRLKLQQIGNSPDAQAMARSLAQATFQGKLSDLAQAREQAALTAASLGSAWAGLGDALFARPLDGAWQTILQPAAASLNEAWRESIASPFNHAFNGRYPFYDTQADASFAELGRYARPDSGLISRFLAVELAGVLTQQGDRWVPHGLAPQALAFDPAFLSAMQQMATVGARLYARGDAGYRFEIMPQPTPNVTESNLTIDQQHVIYFNQRESWSPIGWPGDGLNGHAALTWQTINAGVRQAFDAPGDWAFLRLLAQAQIKPLDSTRYELTWQQPGAEALHYVLRTQVGAGPMDLLALRGFKMPEQIFIVGKSDSATSTRPTPSELQSP
jgi:type VI secretion system protein ImpL